MVFEVVAGNISLMMLPAPMMLSDEVVMVAAGAYEYAAYGGGGG